ncbi:peptidase M50 [Alkalidesulfovibrio alkalitolerans DSM 16529]|jgi:Zn-dependent protease|uniref:Peptidase M50 n=1 Tax=Alkalidesulfovibrio alkalitolerans DSM 16529 TaxID=1121439 RepID=S7TCT5_9BACT|nr:site-2 protease family protein [Alkalidesulfovibrio alkalitolerans]EPR35027.1 peptidase M50 [Alkalidesulfovibrio alkalitolerans DSM 16529]
MFDFNMAGWVQKIALITPGFLLAITVHELCHGLMAFRLGDPTARMAGRLTLNPFKHLDVMGTIVLVLTQMIGWAKPVPVDPRYFRNPRQGMALVAVAGPLANFITAAILARLHLLVVAGLSGEPSELAVSILLPLTGIIEAGVLINLVLGCFNLLPIPPLDGSNIVALFLPLRTAMQYMSFGRFGFIVIILLAVTGMLGQILWPMIRFMATILL